MYIFLYSESSSGAAQHFLNQSVLSQDKLSHERWWSDDQERWEYVQGNCKVIATLR